MSNRNDTNVPSDNTNLPIRRGGGADELNIDIGQGRTLTIRLGAPDSREEPDEPDPRAYWHVLVKRRWLIAGVIAVVVTLALVLTLMTPSTYRATATLMVKPYGMQVMQVQGLSVLNQHGDKRFTETQVKLLSGPSLVQRVVENLHLDSKGVQSAQPPPSWFARVRSLMVPGARASPALGAATATSRSTTRAAASGDDPDPDPATTASRLSTAVHSIEKDLTVEPIRNTYLVDVSYTSTVPAFSARVANAVASAYIAASMDRQIGASSYASKYLKDQLQQLRSRLQDSETALVEYAKKEDIVPSSKGTSLVSENLTDLNAQLATAQAKRIAAEARWNTVEHSHGTALPADLLEGSILPQLRQNLAQLQTEYQEKLKTFKPRFPAMRALKNKALHQIVWVIVTSLRLPDTSPDHRGGSRWHCGSAACCGIRGCAP